MAAPTSQPSLPGWVLGVTVETLGKEAGTSYWAMVRHASRLEQVTEAIKQAGLSLGWRMAEKEPGRIIGTLRLRSHEAVVEVLYDTERYSITYLNSVNLKYDGQRIHKNYNSWVQNLSNAIYAQVSSI